MDVKNQIKQTNSLLYTLLKDKYMCLQDEWKLLIARPAWQLQNWNIFVPRSVILHRPAKQNCWTQIKFFFSNSSVQMCFGGKRNVSLRLLFWVLTTYSQSMPADYYPTHNQGQKTILPWLDIDRIRIFSSGANCVLLLCNYSIDYWGIGYDVISTKGYQ